MIVRYCDCCGKKIPRFDSHEEINLTPGYGSRYDGKKFEYIFCIDCADKFIDKMQTIIKDRKMSVKR